MTDDVLWRFKLISGYIAVCGSCSVRPIGLGPNRCSCRSGQVGPSFKFIQSVSVRSGYKEQLVWFGWSRLVNLRPTGLDQDRTETEVEHPCTFLSAFQNLLDGFLQFSLMPVS